MSHLSATFDKQLDAFNNSDLDSFLSAYSLECTISRDGTLTLSGRDEMRAFYEGRFQDKSLHCDVLEKFELGGRWLVAHERVSSSSSAVEVVAVFEIENELITRASMLTVEA